MHTLPPDIRRTPRARFRLRRAVPTLVSLTVLTAGAGVAFGLTAPHAGGDSAANISVNTAGERVMTRWVAARTGTISTLYLRVKVENTTGCIYGGRTGYAAGTSGAFRATTYRVLPDGRPDTGAQLAQVQFTPCQRQSGESVDIPLNFAVTKGEEFATVVQNADGSPTTNWFSTNHLYTEAGVQGANGRNERNPDASDAYYGLDPREIVGYSTDGGATWSLPGGPYGAPGGKSFIASYIQKYSDGAVAGQPYYWTAPVSGTVAMVYPNVPQSWTISELGAFTAGTGSSAVILAVDGQERARVTLSGRGMLRAPISPVTVAPGQTVKVTTTAGSGGLNLEKMYADSVWAGIMGLSTSYRWYMEGSPQNAVPVYPLPMYGVSAGTPAPAPAPPPAPAPAPAPGATLDPADKALGRPATSSSVESSLLAAGRATDGLPTTRWSSLAANGQWWQVDLGRSRKVSDVAIDWETAYASRYQILTSTDGVSFSPAADVSATSAGTKTTSFTARDARFVRILAVTRATAWGVSFWDVRVRGPVDAPLMEKATGRPAVASSSQSAAFAAGSGVDGVASTRWSSASRDGEWWQVDLGRDRSVSEVAIDWEAAYASRYRILTSSDGATFAPAADVQLASAGAKVSSFPARPARYLRVVGTTRATKYGVSFFEARVLGTAD